MIFLTSQDVSHNVEVRKQRSLEWGVGAEIGLFKHSFKNQKKNYFGSNNPRDPVFKKLSEPHVTYNNIASDKLTGKRVGFYW